MGAASQRGFGGSAAEPGVSTLDERMLASPHCGDDPDDPSVTAPALSTAKASKQAERVIARRNDAAIAMTGPVVMRYASLNET
ncbi:MAG: hypothetical protein WCJ76_17445, partial [Comamonadaceae bacterium]